MLNMPNMTVGDFCDYYTISQIKKKKNKKQCFQNT
jgi:hypothetical protein